MRNFFYKITAILFVAVLFISCNGKSSGAKKDKTFSFVGLEFNIDAGPDNKKLPLYKDSSLDLYIDGNNSNAGHYEPIEYFDDYVGCEILSYNREHNSAYVNIKNSAGWVPLSHYAVIFDKESLLRSINAALEGNEDARLMLSFNFTHLTLDEALEKLRYIIDYVGVEHFKKLSPSNAEDLVILKAIARLIELSASGYDDITNPVHLLAEVANEDIWKFLDDSNSYPAGRKGFHDNYLSYFYNNSFFDSEGVSALMHAIKAKNLDTLKYFYENKIPDYYFSRLGKTNRDDKEKIYHLIQSTKDKNGKSLADYVAECDDEKIKRFMAVYDVYNDFSVKECLEYLRGLKKNGENLNDFLEMRHKKFSGFEVKWLGQVDFYFYNKKYNKNPTVIKETKLLTPKGEGVTVKPLEKVVILELLENGEGLWDYGMQDPDDNREYFYRYNYYLVRTEDYKTGIIGGSSLAHLEMGLASEDPYIPVGGCESPYSFYVSLMYTSDELNYDKLSYYGEIFEANRETKEIHAIESGYREDSGFEKEPVHLGNMRMGDFPTMIDLIAYRDSDMEKYKFFDEKTSIEPSYSFLFRTELDQPELSYNSYTVDLNTRCAFKNFYKTSGEDEKK